MSQAPLTLRRWKGSLYGIVNLPDGLSEVYREPLAAASAVYGWR